LRFDPNPGVGRVVAIGALLFMEALLLNLLAVLQQGRMPTAVEWATFLTIALLQLVTYLLGFLRREEKIERR